MPRHSYAFTGIGTAWRVDTTQPLPAHLRTRITARVDEFDLAYSRFRPDSVVADVARSAGCFAFPSDATDLFTLYRALYDATGGAVTPFVGGTLEHLGYGPGYSLERGAGPGPDIPSWDDVIAVEANVVRATRPVPIDLGAAGKGYLVDLIGELLLDAGVEEFVIDASGDMLHRGDAPEMIGLEDPHDQRRVIGVLPLGNAALCASSVTRRHWGEGLHHVIDPGTRLPVHDVVATWVIAESCAVADGVATALFLADPPALARAFAFAYVRLWRDGRVDFSAHLESALFL